MSTFYSQRGLLQKLPLAWLDSLSFRMGIRPFTTIKHDGQGAQLWSYHRHRLEAAMKCWGASQQSQDDLLEQCSRFLNEFKQESVIRIDLVLLDEPGNFEWYATVREPLATTHDVVFELVDDLKRTSRPDSQIKYADYKKEELLKRELKNQRELLFEDPFLGLQEASTSNILVWNSRGALLPVESEKGILEGVYLKAFCDFLRHKNIFFKTEKLFYQSGNQESLLVLSNCAKGFRRARQEHELWSPVQERLWLELKELECEFLNFSKTGQLSPV